MRAALACLVFAYVLSQFYRAFLAVLSPLLTAEIGATPEDLAAASGLWFLAFSLMQIPVGSALDRVGPRVTTALLLAVGAAGAGLFAAATGPGAIKLAMVLIGIGCSPVLMAGYFIFARIYPPALFGTLAGAMIGVGSFGNIASALPLAWAVDSFGWRPTVAVIAAITLATALTLLLGACSKEPANAPASSAAQPIGSDQAYDAVASGSKGFTAGPMMNANAVYVLFDPQCPHCGHQASVPAEAVED
jgi:sugar phosphate permease